MPSVSEPKIAQLCRALRSAGLSVGIDEELRLHTALAALDSSDSAELADVIAAVVLKSQRQRPDFQRVVSAWVVTQQRRSQAQPEPTPDIRPRPARPQRRWPTAVLVSCVVLVASLCLLHWCSHGGRNGTLDKDMGADLRAAATDIADAVVPDDLAEGVVDRKTPAITPQVKVPPPPLRVPVFVPHIAVSSIPVPKALWAYLGMLLLSAGVGVVLRLVRRKPLLPTPQLLPMRRGLLRVLPASVALGRGTAAMLSRREQEIVVWGIGRFVSEEPSPTLDIRNTILATSHAAGLPQLRYLRQRHSREVWLWTDASLGTYADGREAGVTQLVADLRAALGQAGLPLEEASYYGLPSRLLSEHGAFAPSEVDDRRDAAVALLLTDGRLLSLALASGQDRVVTLALLRQLSHWPRLAFVDCGQGVYRLRELLAPLGIAVIQPSEVPSFLGGTTELAVQSDANAALQMWAAVCALSPFPIDDQTALALRHKLGLTVSPWAVQTLRSFARSQGARFVFPPQVRADKLHWLCAAEDLYRLEQIPKDSLLGQALDFYRQQLAQEDRYHRSRDGLTPFVNTPAEQNLRVQVALLDLWDRPELAARTLFRYFHSSQARTIQEALRLLVSAEYLDAKAEGRDRAVTILPWRFDKLTAAARVQLQRLGLGQGIIGYQLKPVQLAPAARQKVAWAVCAGMVLSAMVGAVSLVSTWLHPLAQPIVLDSHRPDGGIVTVEAIPQSRAHQVSAQYAFVKESQRVPAGAQVQLTWQPEQRDPPDAGSDKPQDLGLDLATPPDFSHIEDLAAAVDLRQRRGGPDLAKPSRPPSDMTAAVVADLRDLGTVPAQANQGGSLVSPDLGTGQLWTCPYQEWTEPKSGMVFVKVCAGTFPMGSDPSDPDADSDEDPAHPVQLSDYWIGKYEVSNAQYRAYKPAHQGSYSEASLPVEMVSWFEARNYCRSIQGDLPTEAEWEYAARGPTGRKYPWKVAAKPRPGLATFGRSWTDGPQMVTANPDGSGPFGTLNQVGNVWEWVEDCYDAQAYRKRGRDFASPTRNPVDDRQDCSGRVLRGGSFGNEPWDLRSASRDWGGPESQVGDFGFRCVRGSGRHH